MRNLGECPENLVAGAGLFAANSTLNFLRPQNNAVESQPFPYREIEIRGTLAYVNDGRSAPFVLDLLQPEQRVRAIFGNDTIRAFSPSEILLGPQLFRLVDGVLTESFIDITEISANAVGQYFLDEEVLVQTIVDGATRVLRRETELELTRLTPGSPSLTLSRWVLQEGTRFLLPAVDGAIEISPAPAPRLPIVNTFLAPSVSSWSLGAETVTDAFRPTETLERLSLGDQSVQQTIPLMAEDFDVVAGSACQTFASEHGQSPRLLFQLRTCENNVLLPSLLAQNVFGPYDYDRFQVHENILLLIDDDINSFQSQLQFFNIAPFTEVAAFTFADVLFPSIMVDQNRVVVMGRGSFTTTSLYLMTLEEDGSASVEFVELEQDDNFGVRVLAFDYPALLTTANPSEVRLWDVRDFTLTQTFDVHRPRSARFVDGGFVDGGFVVINDVELQEFSIPCFLRE